MTKRSKTIVIKEFLGSREFLASQREWGYSNYLRMKRNYEENAHQLPEVYAQNCRESLDRSKIIIAQLFDKEELIRMGIKDD